MFVDKVGEDAALDDRAGDVATATILAAYLNGNLGVRGGGIRVCRRNVAREFCLVPRLQRGAPPQKR